MTHQKKRITELDRLSVEGFQEADKMPLVLVLDNIRSASNVGAIFRTADAYRVQEIRLCGITAQPPHPEIRKTALGATDSVVWSHWDSTLEALQDLQANGVQVASVEQAHDAVSLEDFDPSGQSWAVVMGNEVKGVDQEVMTQSDIALELPQFGTKHSLNVAVCAGIVIWEFARSVQFFKPS